MPNIDYEALAKQYGGTTYDPNAQGAVDYDKLAQQYGGTTQEQEIIPSEGSGVSNLEVLKQYPAALGETTLKGLKTLGKAGLSFLNKPVEFIQRTGTTIGTEAAEIAPFNFNISPETQQKTQAFKQTLQAPSVFNQQGAAPFTSKKEAALSGLSAAETLTAPLYGIQGGLFKKALVRGLTGALTTGTKGGIESGTQGLSFLSKAGKAGATSVVLGQVLDYIPFLQNIAKAESELSAALKAVPGKPINSKTVASSLDNIIGMLGKVPGAEGMVKRITKIRANLSVKPNLSAEEAQEAKRAIYTMREAAYEKGTADVVKKADQAVARAYKEEIERVAPQVKPINKRYGTYFTAKDIAEKLTGKGIGLGDVPYLQAGGLGFDLARRATGLLLQGLMSRTAQSAVKQIPSQAAPLTAFGITKKFNQ